MRNWKLAMLLIGLLAGTANACDPKQDRGSEAWQRFTAPAKRLAGRVLGNFSHEGMTEAQVQEILGCDDCNFFRSGGGLICCEKCYLEFGVDVMFARRIGDRPYRVTSVHYGSLFKWP